MKILVAGALGQLGRALEHALDGHDLVLRDLPELDLADAAAVATCLDETGVELVINAAAYTDVDGAELTFNEHVLYSRHRVRVRYVVVVEFDFDDDDDDDDDNDDDNGEP